MFKTAISDQQSDIKAKYSVESDDTDMPTEEESPDIHAEPDKETDEPKPIPQALKSRMTKQYAMATCVAIFTIVMVIIYRTPQCILGFAVAGTLVYLAIALKLDFKNEKISELCLICATVHEIPLRKVTRVVFRTQQEIPQYFEFRVPGKKHHEFIPNHVYLVYFREDSPQELLGITAL